MTYPPYHQPGPHYPQPGYQQPAYDAPPAFGQPAAHGQAPVYGPAPIHGQPQGAHGYGAPYSGPPAGTRPGWATGGGTAITAAILALLGGLYSAVGLVVSIVGVGQFALDSPGSPFDGPMLLGPGTEMVLVYLGFGAVSTLLLLVGAVLLLLRKSVGRVLVIVGSALTIASKLAMSVWMLTIIPENLWAIAAAAAFALPPGVTLLLACLPATGRWVRAARQPGPSW